VAFRSVFVDPDPPRFRLNREAERKIEDSFANDREAHRLLDLIVTEFESDPMSVQCFDLRIVEAAKLCVAKRRRFVKDNPLYEG
jgi:hypothetical protein